MNEKKMRLQRYIEKTEQQMMMTTDPELKKFFKRDIDKTKAVLEQLVLSMPAKK